MNDKQDEKILSMLRSRDEDALRVLDECYRGLALSVLGNLLEFKEDREECMNDAFLKLWNTIPPENPHSLKAYFTEILRNFALMKTRAENTWKRGGRVLTVGEEFLADITDGRTLADDYESALAGRILNDFLGSVPKQSRQIFIMRYWLDEDISYICSKTGRSVSSVKSLLKRLRDKLREELKKEGIIYD